MTNEQIDYDDIFQPFGKDIPKNEELDSKFWTEDDVELLKSIEIMLSPIFPSERPDPGVEIEVFINGTGYEPVPKKNLAAFISAAFDGSCSGEDGEIRALKALRDEIDKVIARLEKQKLSDLKEG